MKTFRDVLLLGTLILLPIGSAFGQEDPALELAARLLGPWGVDAGFRVEIVPGETPAGLDVELPLPSSLEIVGSSGNYRLDDGEFMHGQVVLDSPLESQDTLRLIEGTFASAGWEQQQQTQQIGFLPANPHVSAVFCSPENEAQVYLNAFPLPEGGTDVRYELSGDSEYNPCAPNEYWPGPDVPLPAFPAPVGSETTLQNNNWYEDQATTAALIETDLTEDELLGHFEEVLEGDGWTRAEDPQRSRWMTVDDEAEWIGVLEVSELASGRFYASFAALRTDN